MAPMPLAIPSRVQSGKMLYQLYFWKVSSETLPPNFTSWRRPLSIFISSLGSDPASSSSADLSNTPNGKPDSTICLIVSMGSLYRIATKVESNVPLHDEILKKK